MYDRIKNIRSYKGAYIKYVGVGLEGFTKFSKKIS